MIVLASGSPRRRQLLEMIGLEFRVVPPKVDESLGPAEQAEGYVTRLAREKATTVAGRERGAVVLAADTIRAPPRDGPRSRRRPRRARPLPRSARRSRATSSRTSSCHSRTRPRALASRPATAVPTRRPAP